MTNNVLILISTIAEKANDKGFDVSFCGSLKRINVQVTKERENGSAPFMLDVSFNENGARDIKFHVTSCCYLGYSVDEMALDVFEQNGVWVQDTIDMLEFIQELKEIITRL